MWRKVEEGRRMSTERQAPMERTTRAACRINEYLELPRRPWTREVCERAGLLCESI